MTDMSDLPRRIPGAIYWSELLGVGAVDPAELSPEVLEDLDDEPELRPLVSH